MKKRFIALALMFVMMMSIGAVYTNDAYASDIDGVALRRMPDDSFLPID